jgi:phage baseplate assembly protein W
MSPRRREADVAPFMGRDLRLDYRQHGGYFEDADLVSGRARGPAVPPVDLFVADGLDNFTQAIANRLKTRKGELTALGHPEYGSRHHELIGQPNVVRTRNLIKLYVLQALAQEPRIEKVVSATVDADAKDPARDTVRIQLQVRVIGQRDPLNLIVPFSLGGAL